MSAIITLVRGNTVHVEASFVDAYGQPAVPASVTASFSYFAGGAQVTATDAMTFDLLNEVWFYDWDSSVSDGGDVFWSVFTPVTMQPAYADEGTFALVANSANLNALI